MCDTLALGESGHMPCASLRVEELAREESGDSGDSVDSIPATLWAQGRGKQPLPHPSPRCPTCGAAWGRGGEGRRMVNRKRGGDRGKLAFVTQPWS